MDVYVDKIAKDELKKNTIRALSWSLLESVGVQLVRFVFGVILARLLFPEQFGLIGMLWVFIVVAQSFADSGYGTALIQRQGVTAVDVNSIFYFNIVVSLLAMGAVCLAAPWIAEFFNQPELTSLTRVTSVVVLLNSLGTIHFTLIHKNLDFKVLAKVSLIETLLSGTVGIAFAFNNFGVWSLVAQQVSGSIFRTLLLWFLNPWRPSPVFSFESLRLMFGFGSKMLVSSLLEQIFSNIYQLVIAKLFTPADLGYFTRAKTFQEIPTNSLCGMVSRVVFPVFSSIQDDTVRLKVGLQKALTTLGLIHFPVMFGMAAIAEPLVMTLLTDKWADCIPYLRLMCFAGFLYPAHLMNLNILIALGRSDLFLRLEIIKKILIIACIAMTWPWGISGMIVGLIVLSFLSFFLNSYFTGKLIHYPASEQLLDMLPYLGAAAIMGASVYAVDRLSQSVHGAILIVELILGIGAYVVLCWAFRLAAFMDIWKEGRNKLHKIAASKS